MNEPCSVERRKKTKLKGFVWFLFISILFVCCCSLLTFSFTAISKSRFSHSTSSSKKNSYINWLPLASEFEIISVSLIRCENIFISRFFFLFLLFFYYFLNEMPFKWYDLVKMRIAFIVLLSIDYYYYCRFDVRCFSFFSIFIEMSLAITTAFI